MKMKKGTADGCKQWGGSRSGGLGEADPLGPFITVVHLLWW